MRTQRGRSVPGYAEEEGENKAKQCRATVRAPGVSRGGSDLSSATSVRETEKRRGPRHAANVGSCRHAKNEEALKLVMGRGGSRAWPWLRTGRGRSST